MNYKVISIFRLRGKTALTLDGKIPLSKEDRHTVIIRDKEYRYELTHSEYMIAIDGVFDIENGETVRI